MTAQIHHISDYITLKGPAKAEHDRLTMAYHYPTATIVEGEPPRGTK